MLLAVALALCVGCDDLPKQTTRIETRKRMERESLDTCRAAGGVPIFAEYPSTVGYDDGIGYVYVEHLERCDFPVKR